MTKYIVYSYSSYYNSDGTLCYEAVVPIRMQSLLL